VRVQSQQRATRREKGEVPLFHARRGEGERDPSLLNAIASGAGKKKVFTVNHMQPGHRERGEAG